MTTEQTFEQKLETKVIPRFDIPHEVVREDFHGCRTVIRRATTVEAAVSFHRLAALLGPTVLKALSWSDEYSPTARGGPRKLSDLLDLLDFDRDETKAFVMQSALPALQERFANISTHDILFHVDNIVVGKLTVNGVPINDKGELDATGIPLTSLINLLWDALECNYFPTFAAPSTESGSGVHEPERVKTARSPRQRRKKSSGKGGTAKGGRSARTRKN